MTEPDPAAAAAAALQTNLEWVKIQTTTAQYIMGLINGERGKLNHFLTKVDNIIAIIERRTNTGT